MNLIQFYKSRWLSVAHLPILFAVGCIYGNVIRSQPINFLVAFIGFLLGIVIVTSILILAWFVEHK